MITVQCAAYAETDINTPTPASDNDIELTAVPVEDITGEGALTTEEADKIKAAVVDALEAAEPPEDLSGNNQNLQINIPDDIAEIGMFKDQNGATDRENFTARANAAAGIIENYLADNPELFYLEGFAYSYDKENNTLTSIGTLWKHNKAKIEEIQSELDAVTEDISMQMTKDGIDLDAIKNEDSTPEAKTQAQFDAALWLHDYLADTIAYDYRTYSTDPTVAALVERTIDAALLDDCLTVCQGYAGAYKYLLEKIGMECVNVYSDTEQHEWSAVKIGDAWYYVDVTQDDSDQTKNINHNFFLVTADELLANTPHAQGESYTHHEGYITELKSDEMTFGDKFEGALWHANLQTVPTTGEQGEEGEESEPTYNWYEGSANSRIVFDGDDRYYCDYGLTNQGQPYTAIYKCGADLSEATEEEFYVINDGVWYTEPATKSGSRSYVSGYYGGLGKYTYEATDDSAQKTCLYFNSPTTIYELELGTETPQAKIVAEYTPTEGENYNCIFGISTRDTLKYQIDNITVDAGHVTFTPKEDGQKETTVACNVRLYEGTENPVLTDILTYPKDTKLPIPAYKKYGVVLKGWIKDLATDTPWDFETDTLTESIKLYADTEPAKMGNEPLQLKASDNCLIGTLDASITDFDATYRESPAYMLAIYDNNTLVAIKTSTTGEFELTAEDNIPYTETTTVKVYAWSSDNEPYLDGASVEIIEDVTGGEGEGETGGESGGETGGESGGGEGTEGGGGEESGGGEGTEGGGNENESGTGGETGSGAAE